MFLPVKSNGYVFHISDKVCNKKGANNNNTQDIKLQIEYQRPCFYVFNFLYIFRSTDKEDTPSTSNNSTQTPSDLSPLLLHPGDDVIPKAHHQNPGHCISSFTAINKMRKNAQVINFDFPINCTPYHTTLSIVVLT